ncbi:MAG: SUMF1/EgtB/PvdO family nonheme iron enzyme [Chthonomonadaceae bacterium]|nr:SUMF1/EgtB/PvdO family nonheme iron enzyme [Chthonomonadaceae bacterium]
MLPLLAAFVSVQGGMYWVGSQDSVQNPRRKVKVAPFEIAVHETTNREFLAFVTATKYVTVAERKHNAMVFRPPRPEFRWIKDKTASWRFPNGTSMGGIEDKMDHPVTTISYQDAIAYCKWAKVRLPNIDEWEIACRAGTDGLRFFQAEEPVSDYANIWLKRDHKTEDFTDGYMYTSPVGSFKPNPWGLYDTYGNVFEFCSGTLPGEKIPGLAHARGGSWWCSQASCCFFNSVDLGKASLQASFSNQGFRVVRSP